ncbi:MAG: hypothetical protein HKN83_08885 [Gammaproteobacteria bacterium]|nr:hypothetical protein [Gammaproteobacteria bacterium]
MDLQPYYFPAAIAGHLLAAVIWVGGMFFAYISLRPAAAKVLEMPQRLKLWKRTLSSFFFWVWICVITLPATGYWMIIAHYGGMARVGWHVHLMQVIGIIMILIFMHVFFAPFRRLCKAVKQENFQLASENLAQVRKFIGINLLLGVLVVIIAVGLRYIAT